MSTSGMNKRLLALCLGGFVFTSTPVSAGVIVKIARTPTTTIKQKNGNKTEQLPQQGGLPDFDPAGNWQSIKGEGEGAGDAPIIAERGGMPTLDFNGYASFFPVMGCSSITYYDGSNKPDVFAETLDLKSDSKTKFDKSGLGLDFEAGLNAVANVNLSKNLKAGASLELQVVKDDFEVDKAYLYLDYSKFAKILLGNTKGPDSTFDVGGQSLIGGAGGINGSILSNIDYATGVFIPRAVVGNSNKASKIFISTREFGGFKFGISFTPDTSLHGHNVRDKNNGDSSNGNNAGCFRKGKDENERPSGTSNLALGVRYEKNITPDLTVRASAAFVTESTRKFKTTVFEVKKLDANKDGKFFDNPVYADSEINEEASSEYKPGSKEIELNNAKSFQCSVGVTYKNLTIAGGYLNSGKSRLPKESAYKSDAGKTVLIPAFMCDEHGNAGRAWNMGARYDWNKWAFACVYHNTTRQITKNEHTKGHIFSFTVDYLYKPGFKIFAGVDYVNSTSSPYACTLYNLNVKSKNAISKQSGFLFLAGFTIQF